MKKKIMCSLNEQDILGPSVQPSSEKNARNCFSYDVIMPVKLTLPTDSVVVLAAGGIFLISPYLEHFPH